MNKFSLLKSPAAVILGLAVGAFIGIFYKPAVPYLRPVGDIYLALLQMCVLPIMISAIVTSISGLLRSESGRGLISKIIFFLGVTLFLVAAICIAVSAALPGIRNPSVETKIVIGNMLSESTNHAAGFRRASFYGNTPVEVTATELSEFFVNLVPKNIFTALSGNENLKIVFFFSVFAILITLLDSTKSDTIRSGFETVYKSFQNLISFMMYFLPFGLCAMTATQFSEIGVSMISSMLLMVLLVFGVSLIIFALSFMVICIKGRCSAAAQFKAMGETLFIAMGTKNSFAAIPSAISGLSDTIGLDRTRVSAVLPMGISICRFGNIMVFTLASVFACGLYDVALNFTVIALIITGSIFAGIASSGAPGIVARSMVAIVLDLLLIPSQSIVVMLTMIDPIIDPFATLVNVYPNCAVTAIVSAEETDAFEKLSA